MIRHHLSIMLAHIRQITGFIIFLSLSLGAESIKPTIQNPITERAPQYQNIAQEIWELAELGYLEKESSGILKSKSRRGRI